MGSDPQAAKTIQNNLKELLKNIKKYDEHRRACEPGLEIINSLQDKIHSEEKISPANQIKLLKAYQQTIQDSEKEEEELRKALDKIYNIRRLRNEMRLAARASGNKENIRRAAHMKMLASSAQTIPLWVGKDGEEPPELCGSIPADQSYIAEQGDMVAALVKGPEDENWILAEVVAYNSVTGKYDVDDIDEEQKDRHTLSKRKIIPLPTFRASQETCPEALFDKGQTVMAIYPQCPLRDCKSQRFKSYADGYSPPLNVAQRYVIQVLEKKKGKL
ncbi:SAGA-associated factor 29 [Eurytemora carolleeae]|uniref:SAGA-associated factor 29 n=1 Tax=Eurytemora carolleeae TaxID=1294199 RepID=UPI000C7723BB|nr:SAGA-associated factor 29 [Eurytemora carolleeae]|eukprot:XP_023320209.1 SAGA-associated factor 29-like [Eurytemora affinis]